MLCFGMQECPFLELAVERHMGDAWTNSGGGGEDDGDDDEEDDDDDEEEEEGKKEGDDREVPPPSLLLLERGSERGRGDNGDEKADDPSPDSGTEAADAAEATEEEEEEEDEDEEEEEGEGEFALWEAYNTMPVCSAQGAAAVGSARTGGTGAGAGAGSDLQTSEGKPCKPRTRMATDQLLPCWVAAQVATSTLLCLSKTCGQ